MKRRHFLTGALAGAGVLSMPFGLARALAAEADPQRVLSVSRRTIEVNSRSADVFGLQGPDGSPGLRFRAGQAFNVLLQNHTSEETIVHWHGLTPPWPSDGVPDAPMPLIAAAAERAFDFPLDRPGTYWMHAHTLQEQQLLAAPLIVADPADDGRDEQEVVVLLHDFSFTSPAELLARLTANAAPMQGMDMGAMDMGGMDMSGGAMSNMDMSAAPDLNDIDYDAYLANDRTLDDPEIVAVERGGHVRVRIINGATATAFTIDFGELEGELIAVDGQNVQPVKGSRFPMTMGQRIDVRLALPPQAKSFAILALREGGRERTGLILRPSGADVAKVPTLGADNGATLDLQLEAQLKAIAPMSSRAADKSYEVTLAGDMAKYRWSLTLDQPILADLGDRVEVRLTNASMMAHPMHLHGHHFQVVAIDDRRFNGAVRDTVLVPPMRSVTIAVDADNVGQWAFHCHHLYHMATGMMSTFGYRT